MYNRNEIGMKAMESNANVELAHATPRSLYIAVATNGNPAPNGNRMKSFPASTEAAYSGHASGRCLRILSRSRNVPTEKKAEAIIGMIQWISGLADHPNQKRQMGIQNAPIKAGGNFYLAEVRPSH